MTPRPGPRDTDRIDDRDVRERLDASDDDPYDDRAFYGAMAHAPHLFKHIARVFDEFGSSPNLDDEMLELMRLKIAECHQCAYCATVRTVEVMDAVAEREAAVFGEIDDQELSRREYLAVSLAQSLSEDPHRLTDEFFDDLQDVYSTEEIIELLLYATLEVGLDRFCIALELQPTDESAYPDQVEYPLETPTPQTEYR
jgi:alkylhydroperoxidase family enzyme